LACVATVLLAGAACGARPPAARNVLLISVDTLRQDALGCYGNRDVRTPSLDALAEDGVLFREAWSHAPSTLPSHASMLFSDLPWRLGVLRNGDTLAPRPGSLAGALRARGYATAAFTSLAVLDSSFGLAQGFDHYDDDVARDPDRPYLFADEVNARVLPWLSAHHARPFFAFVHYSDPHEPYAHRGAPPDVEIALDGRPVGTARFLLREPRRLDLDLAPGPHVLSFRALAAPRGPRAPRYALRELRLSAASVRVEPAPEPAFVDTLDVALHNAGPAPVVAQAVVRGQAVLARPEQRREYLREVEWVDAAVGRLVAWLRAHGRYEDTAIMLVADHGEGLGDHGTMGHETQLYLSQLRVPMILVDHGHRGVEHDALAALIDVAPTLLALAGAPAPDSWRGEDLLRRLSKPAAAARREVLSATFFGRDPATPSHRKLSVLRPPHHLILSLPGERTELYDVAADPTERHDLTDGPTPHPALDALQRPMRALAGEIEARLREHRAPDLAPEQLERLRALGYLGGGDEEPP